MLLQKLIIKTSIIESIGGWNMPRPKPSLDLDSCAVSSRCRPRVSRAPQTGWGDSSRRFPCRFSVSRTRARPQAGTHAARGEPDRRARPSFGARLLELNDEIVARQRTGNGLASATPGRAEDFATLHLPGARARFAGGLSGGRTRSHLRSPLNLLKRGFAPASISRWSSGNAPSRRACVSGGNHWSARRHRRRRRAQRPLSLVVSPAPCVYRQRAIDALDSACPARSFTPRLKLAGSLAAVRRRPRRHGAARRNGAGRSARLDGGGAARPTRYGDRLARDRSRCRRRVATA